MKLIFIQRKVKPTLKMRMIKPTLKMRLSDLKELRMEKMKMNRRRSQKTYCIKSSFFKS